MRMVLRLFLLLALFSLLTGCDNKEKKHNRNDVLLESYRLIDEDREDEAIGLLDSRIEEFSDDSPENLELKNLKVTLASAYAKKAGISIREIGASFSKIKNIADLKTENFQTSNATNGVDKNLSQFSNIILDTFKFVNTFSALPKVSQEKMPYLTHAVKILNSTNGLDYTDRIYSALLKIILVKSMFESPELHSILPYATKENETCVVKTFEFSEYLLRTSRILLSAVKDLEQSYPDKKGQFSAQGKKITEWTESLVSINATSVVLSQFAMGQLETVYRFFAVPLTMRCQ
jgi:hypothetical protein